MEPEIKPLPLEGAFLISSIRSGDERGSFFKLYTESQLKEIGTSPFLEQYISVSRKGVIRGLHYQSGSHAQAKLIQCIKGSVMDVILDLRKSSRTFGKWHSVDLSEDRVQSLFIPRGFAHGFASLTEGATLIYHVDNNYSKDHERGINWKDPALSIDWKVRSPIISEKDRAWPLFKDAEYF